MADRGNKSMWAINPLNGAGVTGLAPADSGPKVITLEDSAYRVRRSCQRPRTDFWRAEPPSWACIHHFFVKPGRIGFESCLPSIPVAGNCRRKNEPGRDGGIASVCIARPHAFRFSDQG